MPKPCYYYEQGNCRYGSSCRFAHIGPGGSSSGASSSNSNSKSIGGNPSKPLDQVEDKEGFCSSSKQQENRSFHGIKEEIDQPPCMICYEEKPSKYVSNKHSES